MHVGVGEGESCRSLFSNREGIAGRSVGLRHQHKIKDATTSLEPNSPKRFFYTNFVQTVALMSSITSSDVDGRGWALSCKLQDGVATELSSVRCQLFFFLILCQCLCTDKVLLCFFGLDHKNFICCNISFNTTVTVLTFLQIVYISIST